MTDALQSAPESDHGSWQLLAKGIAHGIQRAVSTLPMLVANLSQGEDLSWATQWWPVLNSLRHLGTSLVRGAMVVKKAASEGDIEVLLDDDLRIELMESYDMLLRSIPDGLAWKESIDKLDALYLSWIQDPEKRDSIWSMVQHVEARADEWLAQLVTLIFSPDSIKDRSAMIAFFERAQGVVEHAIDLIFDAQMRAMRPSQPEDNS